MKLLCILIGRLIDSIRKINNYFIRKYQLSQFRSVGEGVYLSSNCEFTEKNISIGDDVYIGKNCCFQSVHGEVIIGNHVMFGPNVHIHGGNHSFNKIGYLMKECNDKEQNSDGKVTICDDAWIGAGAIILKGVTMTGLCNRSRKHSYEKYRTIYNIYRNTFTKDKKQMVV